ncbi:hypothetical protein B0J18DRAFT_444372 [Chaetomium sp. MPI-SDFR-AT-0129]|nr:hypothetical protein B0J18DRAFT_444372 [Chaetomium sp. MPI-SDFR-AT-0129]
MAQHRDKVLADLGFLARLNLYEEVKPYGLRFPPPQGLAQSNIEGHTQSVNVQNGRLQDQKFSFDSRGFCLAPFSTSMKYTDFDEPLMVKDVYCAEVAEAVKAGVAGARHTRVIDFSASNYLGHPPVAAADVNFTPDIAVQMIKTLYGPRADEVISQGWAIVNAWKPLKDAVVDWPLAVCDSRTFDAEHDGAPADVVYRDWISEDVLVHHATSQEWWYFPEQRPDEILFFKSVDSEKGLNAACPHVAFANPRASPHAPLRESVDCRVIVFFTKASELPPEVGQLYGAKD